MHARAHRRPAARAATASLSGATLTFVAADGEANQLAVSLAAGTYTLTDAGAPVTAAAAVHRSCRTR